MQYHRPATYKDGLVVLNHLRPEDKAEVLGMGLPLLHVPFGVLASEHATYFHVDEEPAGIAGVVVKSHRGPLDALHSSDHYQTPHICATG